MAMERLPIIKDTHSKNITALGYNPAKHELLVGCEDGVIKAWDYSTGEPGKLVRTSHEHVGWITSFLFWSDAKLMLSASNDGYILAWGSGVQPHDRVKIGSPIYSMAWNVRREQLILGLNSAVKVYRFKDLSKDQGSFINDKGFTSREHTDIVRNVTCHETRVYSAGFDKRIVIYDSYSYPDKKGLKPVTILFPAHDAGINCLSLARDNENNTWLLSGGFDKTVKVWSQDGQIMHKFDSFSATITGLCYVRQTKTIWVSAGTEESPMYDPKSGDNVSEFIGTFQNLDDDPERHELCLLQYIPDLGQVFGTNSRRHIMCWKYNASGCITALRNRNAAECLTYTKKVPILVFNGDAEGQIIKWERLQSNTFMYSKEILLRSEAIGRLASQISDRYDWAAMDKGQIRDQLLHKQPPSFAGRHGKMKTPPTPANIALLKAIFVEDLDLLVVSSEDGNIYVWGFDEKAVEVLEKMKPADDRFSRMFEILLKEKAELEDNNEEIEMTNQHDSVTNRVAGFICKHVFTEHKQVVSAMAVIGREAGFGGTFLLSTGWDRRILLWNLETLSLQDVFRNRAKGAFESEELAADGIILDLAYSDSRKEFAYAASDKLVYIRKFATSGLDMTLSAVLQGHEAEVTQVLWNQFHEKWVTGSEDGTIRIWSANGMNCDLVLSAHGNVSALCVDHSNGCVVAGVQDTIRVYDIEYRKIVQTNLGHTDSVRSIIHIPERQQYVSASWDKTVRIWNAYNKSFYLSVAARRKHRNVTDSNA
ncbi:uncharacterized WD repeat-containing protein alr2800-like isoform X1 [Rhopilema esculentum]|uniref:uncharacterized WD repeat-containing protein alr2800-like isoform X1 n=1 Tax=Rhopilema esculentum TaxID=499914 RepID=UPI0031DDAF19